MSNFILNFLMMSEKINITSIYKLKTLNYSSPRPLFCLKTFSTRVLKSWFFRTSSSAPLFLPMYFSTHNVWDFSTCPPPCRTQVDGRSTSLKSISILSCKIKSPQHTNTEIDSCGLQGRKGTSFCLHEEVNPQWASCLRNSHICAREWQSN